MSASIQRLARFDETLVRQLKAGTCGPVAVSAILVIVAGAALFGLAFGIWRAPEQALYSAIKMPAMILAVVAVSSLINIILAHVLGSGLSAWQTTTCVLLSLAITCLILAALAPIICLFALQCPPPQAPGAMLSYRSLLTANTGLVAAAGVAGNVRLYRLLRILTPSASTASRVLLSWILTTGLAGCEFSWICSPFLARPDIPIMFLNPNAFHGNFFEYLWRTATGTLLP